MRNTCIIDGRAFRAVPATRGCDGCAAMPGHLGRRNAALCNALPPCAGHLRGGGPNIVWVTRGARPRKQAAYPAHEPGHGAGRVTEKARGPEVTELERKLRKLGIRFGKGTTV